MEAKTVYFENSGQENTEAVLRLGRQRAEELGIKTIVIASSRGDTAIRALDIFSGLRVIVVSHVAGFREPNTQEFSEENRQTVVSKGGAIVTSAHAFAGLSRALRNKYEMPGMGMIIADTLRIFSQGIKVACEIALMAADSGLLHANEDIISIGGTVSGADTAIVVTPANSHRFFELKVKEILCKPRSW